MQNEETFFKKYIEEINSIKRLSPNEQRELFNKINTGEISCTERNSIENKIVESNLLLVVKCINNYYNKFLSRDKNACLSKMDLISEGNLALVQSVKKYIQDNEFNTKFSTYATKSIIFRIRGFHQQCNFIRIPSHHFSYISKIKKIYEMYGSDVNDNIIMEKLNISKEMLDGIKHAMNISIAMLEDTYVGESNESNWESSIQDENSLMPYDKMNSVDLCKFLSKIISELNEKEKHILTKMILNEDKCTFRDVGVQLGISSERCRQILNEILKKMKKKIIKVLSSDNKANNHTKNIFFNDL